MDKQKPMIGTLFVPEKFRDKLHMKTYNVAGKQFNNFCYFNLSQVFVNQNSETVDIKYIFPNDSKFCVYDSEFIIDGRVIKPKLRPKEEAKKEYEQAIQAGHAAMYGEEIGNGLSSFSLGNISPGKEAIIKLKFSFTCDIENNGYVLKYPLAAKYQSGSVTSEDKYKVDEFDFKLEISQSEDINNVNANVPCTVTNTDTKNYIVSIKEKPSTDAIFIKSMLKGEMKSSAINSDNYTFVTAYPRLPKADSGKSNSEYVFLVDCSGSMSGSRIKSAIRCMNVFIKSLPLGCKFAIWRFGSNSVCEIPSSDYNNENIKNAVEKIQNFQANLGGTELLDPLSKILTAPATKGYVRQVFVLTDGEIHNTDNVLAVVAENRHANRIFSIGLGSGADSGLISGLASQGNGTGITVNDNDPKFDEKVIDMLESSLMPALSNSQCISDNMNGIWPSPLPTLYHKTPQSIILENSSTDVLISGEYDGLSYDEVVTPTKVADGIGLREFFMMKAIRDLESHLVLHPNDNEAKQKVINMSISANVLTKYTSFVGVDFEETVNSRPNHIMMGSARMCMAPMRMRMAAPMCKCTAAPMAAPMNMCIADSLDEHIFGGSMAPRMKKEKRCANVKREMECGAPASKKPSPDVCSIDSVINLQNPDGSWDNVVAVGSFTELNKRLVETYGKAAATLSALIYLNKFANERLGSLKLIFRKALAFLKTINDIDWQQIIDAESK